MHRPGAAMDQDVRADCGRARRRELRMQMTCARSKANKALEWDLG